MQATNGPVLVGRRSELTTALRLLDAAVRGTGSTLLVSGEAGVGKTRLLHEVAARATAAETIVLTGRAVPGGGTFRPVAEALAPVLRGGALLATARVRPHRAALRRLLPATGTGVPDPGPGPELPDPSVVLGEAVLAVATEAGGRRGCLLVLEDLHWADPDTLDLVRYLAGAVIGSPVLLALTTHDDGPRGGVRLATAPGITCLPLRRLDEPGVAALAAACRGGVPLPAAELRELVRRSDGLPFLVEELAGPASGIPPRFADLVAERLAALRADHRTVLLAAAVLGDEPDWRLLVDVTGEPAPVVVDALRAAAETGLLVGADGPLRWRHALSRAAVLDTLLAPRPPCCAMP